MYPPGGVSGTYIYICVVGSISGPHLGFLESISGPLQAKTSERGSEFSSLSGVLVQKQAFQKGDGSHPLFQFLVVVFVGGCYLVLDY